MDEKILEILAKVEGIIAEKSPVIWKAFIRQHIINGILTCVLILVAIIGMSYGFDVLKSEPKWAMSGDDNAGAVFILLVFGIVLMIGVVEFFSCGLTKLVNPKYHAIKDLMPGKK